GVELGVAQLHLAVGDRRRLRVPRDGFCEEGLDPNARRHAGRRRTMALLKPPNPRAFTSTVVTDASCASVTKFRLQPFAGRLRLTVGGGTPSRIGSNAAAVSRAPLPAESRPVIVFGAVTGPSRPPKTSLIASASARSRSGTPAASANTASTLSADTPARSSASRIARASW